MASRISLTAGLLLLCAIAPGGDAVEAAGIGVHLVVHGHNIPRAVASGHNPHIGRGVGAGPPSHMYPATRSIQRDTADESAAIKSRK